MVYFSTEPVSERRNPTGKNRVWDFFGLSNETHPANRRQPAQPRRKIRPTPMKSASGIPYWPSRDPIEEDGGINLYGFVDNDGVDWIDFLGRDKAVISGGINMNTRTDPEHDLNWRNFITAAELYIQCLKGKLNPGEEIEWHVNKSSYIKRSENETMTIPAPMAAPPATSRPDYIGDISLTATKLGVKLVWFDSMDELVHGINNNDGGNDPRSGASRLSGFEYFGHGGIGHLFPLGLEKGEGLVFGTEHLQKILRGSFVVGCKCVGWTCNSGTTDPDTHKSFADEWESSTGNPMYAIIGRTDYGPTAVGNREVAKWFFFRSTAKPVPKGPTLGTKGEGHENPNERSQWSNLGEPPN